MTDRLWNKPIFPLSEYISWDPSGSKSPEKNPEIRVRVHLERSTLLETQYPPQHVPFIVEVVKCQNS